MPAPTTMQTPTTSTAALSEPTSSARTATPRLRRIAPAALAAADLQRWAALEDVAVEANAYASPHFVLPALRHLDPGVGAELVFAEAPAATAAGTLLGVFCLAQRRGNALLPLPHVELYHSMHSFCGAPLLAPGTAAVAWEALLRSLRGALSGRFALVIRSIEQDGPAHQALREACGRTGCSLHDSEPRQRAMLYPPDTGVEALKRNLRKQHAEVERCRRRVGETGTLSWHIHRGAIEPRVIEDFLRLEHAGWKGEAGSSLRANPHEEAFFTDMVRSFAAQGRALFTELRLDDRTIASTSNMVSGATGFAFKVGWDPEYRKFGIGILNEAELVRQAPQVCADLRAFDSGAEPASFIEKLWPGRRPLVTSVVAFGPLARAGLQAMRLARAARGRLRRPATAETAAP
ncbi:MAG: GNAT family N-acetyltransferase [Burkholderiaceae bacterium]|nr:GNAT family N-acetyltransferase [Burkholderiaceae bacterium]